MIITKNPDWGLVYRYYSKDLDRWPGFCLNYDGNIVMFGALKEYNLYDKDIIYDGRKK